MAGRFHIRRRISLGWNLPCQVHDLSPFAAISRGKRFGGGVDALGNKIIAGWQLTGITTFSKGQYQSSSLGVDWLNIGSFDASRPNIIGRYAAGRSLPDAY